MSHSILSSFRVHLLIGCLVAQSGCGSTPPDEPPYSPPPPRTPPATSAPFFDDTKILDFKLTFAPDQWTQFQQILANPPPDSMRDTYTKVYVHCGFEALGMKFPDAACRPKGNPSYWKSEPKPQFVVKFDHWDSKGRFLTLRGLNLEANPFALAPLRDRLGMWMMREFGVKAPRVNHVRVFNNGALQGLYMNIEDIDQSFLHWQFEDPNGNLYSQGTKLQTNKQTNDITRLTHLNDVIDAEPLTGDHSQFFSNIDKLVDIHNMLLETAGEVILPAGDNWSNGGTNYDLYDDPKSGKFVWLPWDLDTIMSPEWAPATADPYAYWGNAELQFEPNKLLQLVYQKPEWKKEFQDELVRARDTVYNRMPAYVDQVCSQIRPAFIEDTHRTATPADFDKDCAALKQHVASRTAFLHQVLGR